MQIRDAEDALFAGWRSGRASFHPDGLVDEARYARAPVRVLFLLKEANDPGEPDLRTFLRGGGRSPTWDNVTRWTEGVFRRALDPENGLRWSDFERISDARRAQALRQIGAVNLKKSAGGHTTDDEAFARAVDADADRLRAQLRLYEADLTVCCGSAVTRAVERSKLVEGGEWRSTRRGIRYRSAGRLGLVVDYCHPEARVPDNLLFYGLVDAVDEMLGDDRP